MSKRHYALGGIVLLLIGVLVYKSDIIGIPDFLEDGYQLYIDHWKWTVPATVAVLWFVWSKFFGKKNVRPFATTGVGGLIESTFGGAVVAGIIGIVGIGALFGIFIFAGVTDAVTGGKVQEQIDTAVAIVKNEPLPKRTYRGIECNFEEVLDARQNKIGSQWVPVTVCKDDEYFLFFTLPGQKPEISYRDAADQLLNSRPVTDFVEIESLWGKPGGMPNLYRLSVQKNQSGFTANHLNSVALMIRGSSKTTESVAFQQTSSMLAPVVKSTCPAGEYAQAQSSGVLVDCETVTLYKNGSPSSHDMGADYCIYASNADSVRIETIDANSNGIPESMLLHHRSDSLEATSVVYRLKVGRTFRNNTCT
jgi:hypothetical protein